MIAATRKIHSVFNVAITGALYAVGFGMIYWIGGLGWFLISTVVWTLGETLHHINANAYIASLSPQSHRARINSILPLIYGTGYGMAPMLSGQFIASQGMENLWLLVMMLSAVGAICMVWLGIRDIRRESQQASALA
jgi:fucose permease